MCVYPEDSKRCGDYSRLDPSTLSRYDIVLISFKALQQGFHDSNVDYSSSRILHSTYAIYPPPFLCLSYRLVVVDETQNIEAASTSQVLKMACRIRSARRICVSGTPFGTGRISDLSSLCQFLQIQPYCESHAWRTLEAPVLHVSATHRMRVLHDMFCNITLRRTKAMISEQLGLPAHTVITKPLQFSTFEVSAPVSSAR